MESDPLIECCGFDDVMTVALSESVTERSGRDFYMLVSLYIGAELNF